MRKSDEDDYDLILDSVVVNLCFVSFLKPFFIFTVQKVGLSLKESVGPFLQYKKTQKLIDHCIFELNLLFVAYMYNKN